MEGILKTEIMVTVIEKLTNEERKTVYSALMLKANRKKQSIRNIQKRVSEGTYPETDELEIEKRILLRQHSASKAELLAKKLIKGIEDINEK